MPPQATSPVIGPKPGTSTVTRGAIAIRGHVADGDAIAGVQDEGDGAYRRVEGMLAGLDAAQMRERDGDADGSVSAHAQVAGVVEEDDAGCRRWIDRLHEIGAHKHVGAARFAKDGAAEVVVAAAEMFKAFGERSGARIRKAIQNAAGGFARGVGVDDLELAWAVRASDMAVSNKCIRATCGGADARCSLA